MDTKRSMIAFCGIECKRCPAYQATQEGDEEKLTEVAESWSTEELRFGPEDVICDGCLSDRVFKWAPNCTTRQCCLEKGIDNCAQCDYYICEKLEKHWEVLAEETRASCRKVLDSLRV